jgi:hypothetical protein
LAATGYDQGRATTVAALSILAAQCSCASGRPLYPGRRASPSALHHANSRSLGSSALAPRAQSPPRRPVPRYSPSSSTPFVVRTFSTISRAGPRAGRGLRAALGGRPRPPRHRLPFSVHQRPRKDQIAHRQRNDGNVHLHHLPPFRIRMAPGSGLDPTRPRIDRHSVARGQGVLKRSCAMTCYHVL